MGRGYQDSRIKSLREAAGLTQEALAEEWGVSIDWIKSIETGRRQPKDWMAKYLKMKGRKMKYQIENTQSGAILGIFEAASEQAALESLARDAGYRDHDEACEVAAGDGASPEEIKRQHDILDVVKLD